MSNRVTKLLTAVILMGAPASALASPRTLANGAPACGNTMGKGGGGYRCTDEERDAATAEREREVQKLRAERAARKAQLHAARAKAGAQAVANVLAIALAWKAPANG